MTEKELKTQGYTLAREHFPFGYCQMWKNHDSGHCLYKEAGQFIEWTELAAILRRDWDPLSWDDQAWKRNNVRFE